MFGLFKKNKTGLSKKEIKIAERHRDLIVQNQDIEGLFKLTDNGDFTIALYEILGNRCDFNPNKLKPALKNLLFCMLVDNYCKTDGLLGIFDDEYWLESSRIMINALYEIGASRSAKIIEQAAAMQPKNGKSFYDVADEKAEQLMCKLENEYWEQHDGKIDDLLRAYAEKHRQEF